MDMEEDQETLVAGMPEERGPQTPFEALRAKRDEIASNTSVLIPLGSAYEDMGVCVKYRLLDRSETDEISKRVRKQVSKDRNEFMFRVLLDSMILACEGFYLRPAGVSDEQATPLRDPAGKEHITTFAQFAAHLREGDPFASHRAAVIYIFGDNEFAVGQHGLLLNRWFSNTGLEVDEELLDQG
jgi:hypothetical protein